LAQASTIRSLRVLIRKHNPDILFFSETKALPSVSTPILRQLGFSLMVHAHPSSSRGGLLLAWRIDINIVSFYVSCNIICVWYYSDDPCIKCLLTFVYGHPYKNLCADFWNAMKNFGTFYNDPWVCIGDFNVIISPDDKLGSRPFDSHSSNPFIDFMDGYGMIDLGFCGNPYTWSNHKQGSSLIKERLDGVLLIAIGLIFSHRTRLFIFQHTLLTTALCFLIPTFQSNLFLGLFGLRLFGLGILHVVLLLKKLGQPLLQVLLLSV